MSTRRERANRWWLRCHNCHEWKASHFNPWTKTYICETGDPRQGCCGDDKEGQP